MKTKTMMDPIVEDVRQVKYKLAEKFNYNVKSILEDIIARQKRTNFTKLAKK